MIANKANSETLPSAHKQQWEASILLMYVREASKQEVFGGCVWSNALPGLMLCLIMQRRNGLLPGDVEGTCVFYLLVCKV